MSVKISKNDLNRWADFLLDHSLGGVQNYDTIMVKGEHIAWPLISVLQDKIFAAGGIADINIVAPDNNRGQVWGASIAKHGSVEQIKKVPDWHRARYESMTKYIEILGAEDPSLFASLPKETATEVAKADMPFKKIRLSKQWVLTLFPTKAFADIEDMTLDEYTDLIVKASTTDPKTLDELEEPLHRLLKSAKNIRIRTLHPDSKKELELRMDISDRNIIKCIGKRNFPDGEVFTSPDANSVSGEIFVDLPVFYNGVTIQGIYLKFKDGVITEYSAKQEEETLKAIIETDKGSHRLGEVAFGVNPGLEKALKHPLFVEKVGGTLHIAIGDSYPECFIDNPVSGKEKSKMDLFYERGIANSSAQHVDIVTDFRRGGSGIEVFLDEKRLTVSGNRWIAQ